MGAGLLAGCDQSGMDGPETMTYTAPLSALNNSGVSGQAVLPVRGDQSSVGIDAQGTEAEMVPAQHTTASPAKPRRAPLSQPTRAATNAFP